MSDPAPDPTISYSPFDPVGIVWTRVSPRLITARLVTVSIVFGIMTLAPMICAVVLGQAWIWALTAIPLAILLWCFIVIPRQVRAMGYAERADDLLIRKGVMFRTLVVVPYGRMQYVDVQAGPLVRKLGIASVQLHTASPGTDASIAGLGTAEAERLRDSLASRGEAQLAGL